MNQQPVISADGRFVVFSSTASNLAEGANGISQIFVRDRHTATTRLVSRSTAGLVGNFRSHHPAVSGDGRWIAFYSVATNLVSDDTNGWQDVFVHDQQSGTTARLMALEGAQPNNDLWDPEISADGRYVAFWSSATNLAVGDADTFRDVFVHDRQSGITTVASVRSGGSKTTGTSMRPSISADGRHVAFESTGVLVPEDTNNHWDIYVHDLSTGTTVRASAAAGVQANGMCHGASLSGDGRFVAFASDATNLDSLDLNGVTDVFVHDRQTGETRKVSVSSMDTAGEAASAPYRGYKTRQVAMSADGRFVGFRSDASFEPFGVAAANIFVVGGVRIDPALVDVGTRGGTGSIQVSLAYPGTAWAAVASGAAPWLTVSVPAPADTSVSYTVAANPDGPRAGVLRVAAQPVIVRQTGNSAPVSVADSATTDEDVAVDIDVLANDIDADGDALFVHEITAPTHGTASLGPDGRIRYIPAADYFGRDAFEYSVRDVVGAISTRVVVAIDVLPVPEAPTEAVPPVISVHSPAGGDYLLGASVAAAYSCADEQSTVVRCSGPVASGALLDTSTVGSKSFTVVAEDAAGNVATKTVEYRVVFDFGGFLRPLANGAKQQAGRAIPVKFSLSGNQGLAILARALAVREVACGTGLPSGPDQPADSGGLHYDAAADHYSLVWKTQKEWAGTCRQLSIVLTDGTEHLVTVDFVR
ncbi:MAG TPA: PxKF domain-containing protein [Vicinamibacterales bacterium]|nr:PxKF domain-containing protein [Vicinamibacterales bacterium]